MGFEISTDHGLINMALRFGLFGLNKCTGSLISVQNMDAIHLGFEIRVDL